MSNLASHESLRKICLVELSAVPPDVGLPALPDLAPGLARISQAFARFLVPGGLIEIYDDLRNIVGAEDASGGLTLFYIVGHAWFDDIKGLAVATRTGERIDTVSAGELIEVLSRLISPESSIVVFDTCHAAAFQDVLERSNFRPRFVLYGSAAADEALALPLDRTTSLMIEFDRALRRAKERPVDLYLLAVEIAASMDRDGVLPGRTIEWASYGKPVALAAWVEQRDEPNRTRTVRIIRNALLASGATMAALVVAVAWYIWGHFYLDVDASPLISLSSNVHLSVVRSSPDSNAEQEEQNLPLTSGYARLRLSAGNLILIVRAVYRHGDIREFRFHRVINPGFDWQKKTLSLQLPAASEIQRHKSMTYVSADDWTCGLNNDRCEAEPAYWIDRAPPTRTQYVRWLRHLFANGYLDRDQVLMSRLVRYNRTKYGQRDAAKHPPEFAVLALSSTSPCESSFAPPLISSVCHQCPALMTRSEAECFCESRGMRLPTSHQWELAVRGVDGRLYPWGNRFDKSYANLPGLPDEVGVPVTLKPVTAFPTTISPFGLIDTVGNAGDWVSDLDENNPHFMGGTYRQNGEENGRASSIQYVRDEELYLQEVTARCVAYATDNP